MTETGGAAHRPGDPRTGGPAGHGRLAWPDFVAAILRHQRIVTLVPLILFVLVVARTFIAGRTYTSVATFFPVQSGGVSSTLAGFASQFGVAVPSQDPMQSPDVYSQMVFSTAVLRPVVEHKYTISSMDGCPCSLPQYWKYADQNPEVGAELAIRKLRSHVKAIPGARTGSVDLQVTSRVPALSSQIAEVILTQLNLVNQSVKSVQAGAERRFIQGRLAVAESSLATAEAAMRRFLDLNREYQGSPALVFEWQSLNRKVTLQESLVSSLSQQYETAGIEEVRNTPAIEIPQHPTLPALPDGRWLMVKGLAAIMVGLLLAIGYVISKLVLFEAGTIARVQPGDLAALCLGAARGTLAPVRAFFGRQRKARRNDDQSGA